MNSDVLVKVSSVSKKFCRDLKTSLKYGLYDIAAELNPLKKDRPHAHDLRAGEFWAVKDVSFELKRGECLGLIGRNGAGKTTLLKMLNGLIKPDTGRIEMNGRVGALIALGAGFNPILTGRENIYVNGSVLGLSKREIDEKLEEIIDFAEIRDAIDAPVQSYSSGMQVRLGFAIATAIKPDVLLLDEVLAVGDAPFRNKCYNRLTDLVRNAAVIFVSHNAEQIARLCETVLLMESASCRYKGPLDSGLTMYESICTTVNSGENPFVSCRPPIVSFECIFSPFRFATCSAPNISISFVSSQPVSTFMLRLSVFSGSGELVAERNLRSNDNKVVITAGRNDWECLLGPLALKNGRYRMSVNIIDRHGNHLVWSYKATEFEVYGAYVGASTSYQPVINAWQSIYSTPTDRLN